MARRPRRDRQHQPCGKKLSHFREVSPGLAKRVTAGERGDRMKRFPTKAAALWLTWIGTALLITAALVVIAAIVLTRGVDDLARTAAVAAGLAVPGLLAVVVARMGRSTAEENGSRDP